MTAYQDRQKEKKAADLEREDRYFNPATEGLIKSLNDIDETLYRRGRDAKSDERQKTLDEEAREKAAAEETRAQAEANRKSAAFQYDRADKAQEQAKLRADQQALADKRKAEEERIRADEERKARADKEARAVAEARAVSVPQGDAPGGAEMRPGGLRKSELADRARAAGMTPEMMQAEMDKIEDESRAGRRKEMASEEKDAADLALRKSTNAQGWARIKADKERADRNAPDLDLAAAKKREAEARANLAEAKAAGGKENAFAPTRETVNKLQGSRIEIGKTQDATRAIEDLMQRYNLEDYVGPIDGIAGYLSSKFGLSGESASEIRSTIQRAFDAYRVAVTGAAASNKEMETLKDTIPSTSDSLKQIKGKLAAGKEIAAQGLARIDSTLGAGDVRGGDMKTGHIDDKSAALGIKPR